MIEKSKYHQQIIDYYDYCEISYKDIWDLYNSMAIHYAYWDEKVKNLIQALNRMNEILAKKARIKDSDHVLDAGCGVGGSSIFLAREIGCNVTGITLSDKQVNSANKNAELNNVSIQTTFAVMDFLNTDFPDNSFDVIWAIESVCYAESNADFAKEAYRLLKKGGRLIVADGFFTKESYAPKVSVMFRKWFDGWAMKSIETSKDFETNLHQSGFINCSYDVVTNNIKRSSGRLYIMANFALWYGKLLRLF